MLKMAQAIMLSAGWKRRMIAAAAGAFGAFALAPFDFAPAMLAPMVVSVWLIDGTAGAKFGWGIFGRQNRRLLSQAASAGWWLGFGYFLAGLWWLGAAFLVEADKFVWALPLAVLGLPAGLALFTALGFVAARILWSPGAGRILALAAGLGASEWLRAYALTGFPWNAFGMALGGNILSAQIASIVGLHGLTFLAIAIFAAPATWIDLKAAAGVRLSWITTVCTPLGGAAIATITIFVYGAWRLASTTPGFEPGVNLRIMQPNLPQDEKFRPENKERILTHYLALSDRATSPRTNGIADVTHLIWPESAFPFILSRDAQSLARIGERLGGATTLITGAARIGDPRSLALPGESRIAYYNSIQVIGKGGVILDTYDKAHLVPFGEYLPFGQVLEKFGLRHLVHIPGGFDSGVFRKLLSAPGLPPLAPLVCYEAVFSGEVTPNDGKLGRPGMLLNLTNDGWFGRTIGPYQHLSQARLRTIEEGLPLVRAANTGISAIIDAYGRILNELPLGAEGVLDGPLPKPIAETWFSRHPMFGPFLLLAALFLGAVMGKFRN